MLLFKEYNEEKRLDIAWYQSNNVIYSECDDNMNDFKTLRVTFKNGATYQYDNVLVQDYLMFRNGGLDGSNGKAFIQFIKNKYNCVKLEPKNVKELEIKLEQAKKNAKKEKDQD